MAAPVPVQMQYGSHAAGLNAGYNAQGVPVGPAFSALAPPPTGRVGAAPVQELVNIPSTLITWANSNELLNCLFRVKKQLRSGTLESLRSDNGAGPINQILVEASTAEDAKLARSLLQMSFKNEERLSLSRDRRQFMENELYSAQGALAAGTVIEFKVADDLLGLIIGKGGARIKKITEEFEVKQIKVADGKVVIVGKDHRSAEAARAQLEIFEELVELDDDAFDGIEGDVRSLQDIKNSSDVLVASLMRSERAVKLIGTASSMYSAKVLLAHQLDFARTQHEIRESERDARAKLQTFQRSTGFPVSDAANRGGRGGAGRGGRGGARGGGGGEGRGRGRDGGRDGRKGPAANTPPPAPQTAKAAVKMREPAQSRGIVPPPKPPAAKGNTNNANNNANTASKKKVEAGRGGDGGAKKQQPTGGESKKGGAGDRDAAVAAVTAAVAATSLATKEGAKKKRSTKPADVAAAAAAVTKSAQSKAPKEDGKKGGAPKATASATAPAAAGTDAAPLAKRVRKPRPKKAPGAGAGAIA